jgi:hypothetical protein
VDAEAVTWRWDFGDGTVDTSNSSSVLHKFSPTGTYVVTVTATDASGLAATQTLSVLVDAFGGAVAPQGAEPDSDGDGFSDSMETAMGTDPQNVSSSPAAGQPADPQALMLTKMGIKLSFSDTGNDSAQIGGYLPIERSMTLAGQQVAVNIGGIIRSFVLDAKGGAVQGGDSLKVAAKGKNGTALRQAAKFQVKLTKGALAVSLADEGFIGTEDVAGALTSVQVTVIFNGIVYQTSRLQSYSAKAGKSGASRDFR